MSPSDRASRSREPGASDADGAYDADRAWKSLDNRGRKVLQLRYSGNTLDAVGKTIGLTRERVRQLQKQAETQFADYLTAITPGLKVRLAVIAGDRCALTDDDLAEIGYATDGTARLVALHTLGLSTVKLDGIVVNGWWTPEPDVLRKQFNELIDQAPFLEEELSARAERLKLPVTVEALLEQVDSRILFIRNLGWVRRSRKSRDAAYLWLTTQGEPRTGAEIAAALGMKELIIRETMRRDPGFAQIRPEGNWALSQWNLPSAAMSYMSATDVVVDILRDRGPISLQELFAEARRLYPVGSWRYSQTLSDSRIGLTSSGLYDLTERGAMAIAESEPPRPGNMAESDNGRIIAVKLTVNYELLRGSGINVNRWLTWSLGLRTAPTARRFELFDPPGEVAIRRNTGTSQISSLRAAVQEMGLVDGCVVILVLRPDGNTASLKHGCMAGLCPAHLL